MSGLENNKIFAAVLVAGITAMLGGFVADTLMSGHAADEGNAVEIDASAFAGDAGGAAAEAMPEPILQLIATADIAAGEKLSKACAACHSFDKGGVAKVGPNLWGVIGHTKASASGFAYSEGLKAKGGQWDYKSLNEFLWKPKKYVADTKMSYIGLKKPEDRAAMIAWLRSLSDAPAALPSAADIADEAPVAVEEEPAEGGETTAAAPVTDTAPAAH